MYCDKCGKHSDDSAIFCDRCGNKLNKESDEITFYSPSNQDLYQEQREANKIANAKAAGIICALFVPLFISVFIGLFFKEQITRNTYYKYFGLTWLIAIGFVVGFLFLFFVMV